MFRIYANNVFMLLSAGAFYMLPVHLYNLGVSEAQVGVVMASMGVTNVLTMVWLMFRGGDADPKRLIVIGTVIAIIGCALIAFTESIALITCGRLCQGMGYCLYFVAVYAWVANSCPIETRAKNLGYVGIVTIATQSVASSIAEAIALAGGYKLAFFVAVIMGAVSLLIALGISGDGGRTAGVAESEKHAWLGREGARIALVSLMGGGVFGAVMTFSPLYLIEKAIVPQSLFFIVYASCAVLVRVLCRNLADKSDKVVVARICFVMIAVSMFALGATDGVVTFSLAAALFGFGHGQMFPTMAAHSAEVVAGGHVRAMTLWSGGFILGISAGSWFAGMLAELYAISIAIQISGVLPLIALVAVGGSKNKAVHVLQKAGSPAK